MDTTIPPTSPAESQTATPPGPHLPAEPEVPVEKDRIQPRESFLLRLLATNGGTALITVLLGGVLGAILNFFIQSSLTERETEQARQKFKGEVAMMAYKNHLDQRQDAMKRLYELVGKCASSCETLISRAEIDTSKYPGKALDELITENKPIYNKFLGVQEEWRENRVSVGLLVSFYYEGDSSVTNCWNRTRDSVSKYLECADGRYKKYQGDFDHDPPETCSTHQKDFEDRIGEFTICLEKVNKTSALWQDYGPQPSPK